MRKPQTERAKEQNPRGNIENLVYKVSYIKIKTKIILPKVFSKSCYYPLGRNLVKEESISWLLSLGNVPV